MINKLFVLIAILLFVGYVKLNEGKMKPFSSNEGRRQRIILTSLILIVFLAGINLALSSGFGKQQQQILLLIMFSSTIGGIIALAVAFVKKKMHSKREK